MNFNDAIQIDWQSQDIARLNTHTLASLSKEDASIISEALSLLSGRLLSHCLLILFIEITEAVKIHSILSLPLDNPLICRTLVLATLREHALLAFETVQEYTSNDELAFRLVKMLSSLEQSGYLSLETCLSRLLDVWTDPVFILHSSDARHYAICRNLVFILNYCPDGAVGTRYMKFVKYYIECPRKDTRARGLACIEIMVNKSGGTAPSQKLDFELDLSKQSQVAILRAYAKADINHNYLPLVSNIYEPAEIVDPIKGSSLNQEEGKDIDDLPAYPMKTYKLKAPRYVHHFIISSRLHDYIALIKTPEPTICSTLSSLSKLLYFLPPNSTNLEAKTVVPIILPRLVSLQDNFDLDGFARARFDALVACLHAYPEGCDTLLEVAYAESKWGLGVRVDALRVVGAFFVHEATIMRKPAAKGEEVKRCGKVTRVSRRLVLEQESKGGFVNWLGPIGWRLLQGIMRGFVITATDITRKEVVMVDLVVETCSVIMYTCRSCAEGRLYFSALFDFFIGIHGQGVVRSVALAKAVGVVMEFVPREDAERVVGWTIGYVEGMGRESGDDEVRRAGAFLQGRVKECIEKWESGISDIMGVMEI